MSVNLLNGQPLDDTSGGWSTFVRTTSFGGSIAAMSSVPTPPSVPATGIGSSRRGAPISDRAGDESPLSTFLLTDIEGSTRLWEENGGSMGAALGQHDRLLRLAIEGNGGTVIKTT